MSERGMVESGFSPLVSGETGSSGVCRAFIGVVGIAGSAGGNAFTTLDGGSVRGSTGGSGRLRSLAGCGSGGGGAGRRAIETGFLRSGGGMAGTPIGFLDDDGGWSNADRKLGAWARCGCGGLLEGKKPSASVGMRFRFLAGWGAIAKEDSSATTCHPGRPVLCQPPPPWTRRQRERLDRYEMVFPMLFSGFIAFAAFCFWFSWV